MNVDLVVVMEKILNLLLGFHCCSHRMTPKSAFISKSLKYISTIHKGGGMITVWDLEERQILFQYLFKKESRIALFSDDECYIIYLSDQLYFLRIDSQIVTETSSAIEDTQYRYTSKLHTRP